MNNFYTHFTRLKNYILIRGYDIAGKRFNKRIKYQPYLFVEDPNGQYNTLGSSTRVKKVIFESMYEASKFARECKDVSGFRLHGLERFEYAFINDQYPTVEFNRDRISISNVDIEVKSDDGFPHADIAEHEITAITVKNKDQYYVFGCHNFINNDPNIHYFKCKSEKDLLYRFIKIWISLDTDVVTGWNIAGFDIPYLVNRITKLFDEDVVKLLSPWKLINRREFTNIFGKIQVEYDLVGLAVLDYLQLYKKFTYVQRPNYRLDTIAEIELGENKLDYSEVANLYELYVTNFQKFIEYNIRDVGLVDRLDLKLKLIDLAFAVAFDSKINFQDVFTSVSPWDVNIHNHLLNTKKTVIPQREHGLNPTFARVPGAHVKDPLRGIQKWIVSVDVVSDYPRNMMQWNISPETYVKKLDDFPTVDQIVRDETIPKIDGDFAVAANGCLYRKDIQGVLGELIERMFNDRDSYKKEMIKHKNADEKKPSELLKNLISKFDNLQQAKKIQLNSLYGALANEGFRYYSINNASAVTTNGVLIIKWAEKYINKWLNEKIGTQNVDYVIAIDTDSMYFTLDSLVLVNCKGFDDTEICNYIDNLCTTIIVPYINTCLVDLAKLMNAYSTDKIKMKREVIGSKGFWVAKKRYAIKVNNNEGVQYAQPKIKIMGGEAIRSSTPSSCKTHIKDAIEVILNKDNQTLIDFIKNFREEFEKLPFNDIAFPRSVSDLTKYQDSQIIYKKGCPIHVKGALLYNHYVFEKQLDKKYPMIYDGDKLMFCYLKRPNPINNSVISVPYILPQELNLEPYLDRQLQFEKAFLDPLKNIAETIGWTTEKQNTISSFFRKRA